MISPSRACSEGLGKISRHDYLIAGKDGGKVRNIDAGAMSVKAGFGARSQFHPLQHAGKLAQVAGLTDEKGWCGRSMTFASKRFEFMWLDASIAGAMPKSGSSANTGKAAAACCRRLARQAGRCPALFISLPLVTPTCGISVTCAATADKGIVAVLNSGGVYGTRPPRASWAEYTMAGTVHHPRRGANSARTAKRRPGPPLFDSARING
jgi:sulfide dehydrogenase [flavocytochrome c] flavoprotein subunit